MRCADAAGVVLPAPRIGGMAITEAALSAGALRACFVARIRRLLTEKGFPYRGADRAVWIAGAIAVALGDVVTVAEAARMVGTLAGKPSTLRTTMRRAQHL